MKRSWPSIGMLLTALSTGCQSDKLLTDPDRERAPLDPATSTSEALLVPTPTHTADGYAWADQPTNSSYHPSAGYAFNRSGKAITITKPAGTTGRYVVRFTGLSALLGTKSTLKVTGYNTNNSYCQPTGPKLTSDVVNVRCFRGNNGAPVDAYFTVLVRRPPPSTTLTSPLAFAYANQPTAGNYVPPASSSWNPAGGIRISRGGTGVYTVVFKGIGPGLRSNGGHVQVVAVGTGNQYCVVGGWSGSPDLSITVDCFAASGSPADTKFNVQFIGRTARAGYAWANEPSSPSYTPNPRYSSNNGGGAIQITRNSVGRYVVTFNGLGATLLDGGDVQVTAYGSNSQCKEEFWGPESVSVRCFAPGGALIDSYFDVLMMS
jgi:hypothetical protein